MPEGAEVKIIAEGLAKLVGNRKILEIKPISGRYSKNQIPGLEILQYPQKVTGIGVKGKLIFWMLENDMYVLNTLAMTGGWGGTPVKHSRVQFSFDSGDPVYFNDPRNFGTIKIIKGRNNFIQKLDSMGPDMLSENVSDDLFSFCIRSKKSKTICEALMDQATVCGVGNYVKAEALYSSKISPYRTVDSLKDEELSLLNSSIKAVLRQAYADQGASIRDYKKTDGSAGQATLRFKVYGKKSTPEGNTVIKSETPDGRTTHWCPDVQI